MAMAMAMAEKERERSEGEENLKVWRFEGQSGFVWVCVLGFSDLKTAASLFPSSALLAFVDTRLTPQNVINE